MRKQREGDSFLDRAVIKLPHGANIYRFFSLAEATDDHTSVKAVKVGSDGDLRKKSLVI